MGPARKDLQTEPGTNFFPDPVRRRPRDDFGRPWVVFGTPPGVTLAPIGLQLGPRGDPGLPQGRILTVFVSGFVFGSQGGTELLGTPWAPRVRPGLVSI